ncbi:MAG: hypothetical protein H0X03_06345 [Nitrosopumilus sp.]|nr:hypothetical protein [Nitrosopumilus sp.]
MNVAIYASTGTKVGLGHLKRCLSIAEEFKKLSQNIEFLLDNIIFSHLISESGYSFKHITSLNTKKYDILITDKYELDEEVLKFLKKNCRILVRLDDGYPLLLKDQMSDVIINGNPYGNVNTYEGIVKKDCYLLVGKEFIPMDQKFCKLRSSYKIRNEIKNATITFGASDDVKYSEEISMELSSQNIFANIYVLNGKILKNRLNPKTTSKLKLLSIINNIHKIFAISDIVICSSSSTCWQLATIGLPFITFKTADNQTLGFKYIKETGIGIALEEDAINNGLLKTKIKNLDKTKRQYLYEKSRSDIDCNGSKRIADKLIALVN